MRFLALSLCLAASLHAQSVVVVDASGGPDVDFLSLTEAVTNAPDGALVLVRSGTYLGFEVDAKTLTVASDEGAVVVVTSGCSVRNLQAGQSCTLVGLDLTPPVTLPQPNLEVSDCDGGVWLERVVVASSMANPFFASDSVLLQNSASVVMTNCRIEGSQGSLLGAAAGLAVLGSSVHAYGCTVQGVPPTASGAPGSAGVRVFDGFLFAADSQFTGGTGALGGNFFGCEDGGDGGPGILMQTPTAQALLYGTTLAGGAGGLLVGPGTCATGAVGPPSFILSGSLAETPLAPYRLDVPGPLRSGTPTQLTFTGTAGASAWLVYADAAATTFLPGLFGSLLLAPPFTILPVGTLDGTGSLSFPLRAPAVPAGAGSRSWRVQSLFLDLSGGFVLGSGAPLIVLR